MVTLMWHCTGCDPHMMGIGPVPAIEALMKASSNTLPDIDVFDVRQIIARFLHFCDVEVLHFCS